MNRLFKMKLIDLSIYGTTNFRLTRTFGYEQLVREFASIFGLKSEISLIERTSQRTFMKLIFSLMKNGWPGSLRIRTVLSWNEMIPSKQHSHRFSNISEVLKTVPKIWVKGVAHTIPSFNHRIPNRVDLSGALFLSVLKLKARRAPERPIIFGIPW